MPASLRVCSRRVWAGVASPAGARIALLVLCAATLAGGIVYSVDRGESLRYLDETHYLDIAEHLAGEGIYSLDGVTPTAFRPPGYPLLLFIPVKLGLGVLGCRLVNFLLFTGCLGLVYLITRSRSNAAAAVLAPALCLGYPVLFYTAGTLYPQTLAAFLLLASAWLLFREPRLNGRRAALLGGLQGVAVLTVPTFALVTLFLALWQLLDGRKQALRPVSVMLLSASLIILPWTARNALAMGELVPVSTNGGLNLLFGNTEGTTPNAGVNVDISDLWAAARNMNEVERDHYFAARALDWIAAHPSEAASLYIRKFINYFNYRNELATASESSSGRDTLVLLTYGSLCLLVLLRLLVARRHPLGRFELFVLGLYIWYGLGLAVFFTRIRFRVPLDYLLVCLAAMSAARLLVWLAGAVRKRADPPLSRHQRVLPSRRRPSVSR